MNLNKIFFFSVLCLFSGFLLALEDDSNQPVYIDSNTASYNDNTNISVYTGNVITKQGSLHIESDKLVVHLKNGDVDKMIFTGKPAKFRQLPKVGEEMIFGEGLTGEYYPKKHQLILIEQAKVRQGQNSTASNLIIHDSKNALFKAGDKSSDNERVRSVFMPSKKTANNASGASETGGNP